MKIVRKNRGSIGGGFSLIELLVVIAIMAILAAMLFPAMGWISRRKVIKKATTELAQVQIAIELYKEKYNSYPPDNPGGLPLDHLMNPLYFELAGVAFTNLPNPGGYGYLAQDGRAWIASNALSGTYGVSGFLNTTRSRGDDVVVAKNFLPSLNMGQYGSVSSANPEQKLLTSSVGWPPAMNYPLASNPGLNPIQYNSSSPKKNRDSFDLWVDVLVGGKTNRISNWSSVPEIVSRPYPDN